MPDDILSEAKLHISQATNLEALDKVRVFYLGKKGKITSLLKNLVKFELSERSKKGGEINTIKKRIQQLLIDKKTLLSEQMLARRSNAESVDISLPARFNKIGHIHPIKQILTDIENIFIAQGFCITTGPEIEDDFHNFSALNIPKNHPARAMHDTFYLGEFMLRTHTSPVQIRALLQQKPPLSIIAPGRVYRCDLDMTHTPMFHQVEGLMVDENLSFAQLKGVLIDFLRAFFHSKTLKVRFRPSYFPFTEPSAEVDIACVICASKGCQVCKKTGWLEVLGCGVVHPNVFDAVNIDHKKWLGLAFGMGVERLTMLRYGVDDLRLFFNNDLRFLAQF